MADSSVPVTADSSVPVTAASQWLQCSSDGSVPVTTAVIIAKFSLVLSLHIYCHGCFPHGLWPLVHSMENYDFVNNLHYIYDSHKLALASDIQHWEQTLLPGQIHTFSKKWLSVWRAVLMCHKCIIIMCMLVPWHESGYIVLYSNSRVSYFLFLFLLLSFFLF